MREGVSTLALESQVDASGWNGMTLLAASIRQINQDKKKNVGSMVPRPFVSDPEVAFYFIPQATHQVRKEAGIKTPRPSLLEPLS